MLAAGVATTASTGRLIDRFRDRVVFPITHQGQILGFVGRRNPTHPDDDIHIGMQPDPNPTDWDTDSCLHIPTWTPRPPEPDQPQPHSDRHDPADDIPPF